MWTAFNNSVAIFAHHFQQPWLSYTLGTVQNKFFSLLILCYVFGHEDQTDYIKTLWTSWQWSILLPLCCILCKINCCYEWHESETSQLPTISCVIKLCQLLTILMLKWDIGYFWHFISISYTYIYITCNNGTTVLF